MTRKYTPQQQIDAFWNKVAITANDNLCWEWLAGRNSNGYGTKRWHGRTRLAHQIAWMYPDYVIPEGMEVCHSCDNPSCCNPKHLWIGTHTDNVRDMNRKGRNVKPKGEAHYNCRISDSQLQEIKDRYALGGITQVELAKEYGLYYKYLNKLITGAKRKNRTISDDNEHAYGFKEMR